MAKGAPAPLSSGFVKYAFGSPRELNTTKDFVVCSVSGSQVSVGFLLRERAGDPEILVHDDTPKLFVLFPLIGTEGFSFPIAIHSRQFEPTEARDGVFLWTSTEEKHNVSAQHHHNEELIELAFEQLLALGKLASEYKWKGSSTLARIPSIKSYSWLRADEYRRLVNTRLLTDLRHCRLVINSDGEYIPVSSAIIPIPEGDVTAAEIWRLAAEVRRFSSNLPQECDLNAWSEIVQEWIELGRQTGGVL